MEFIEVFKGRRSIRQFKSDPVSRQLIDEILADARWSPSWANTQPWEVLVVQGNALERLRRAQLEQLAARAPQQPDIPTPEKFPPQWQERVMQVGLSCFEARGIGRGDQELKNRYFEEMFTFFGAPALLLVMHDHRLDLPYGMVDIGLFSAGVCLLAQDRGLGTIILSSPIRYPDMLRRLLPVSDQKRLVLGIAMGYPDENARINRFKRQRTEVSEFTTWAE